MDGKEYQTKQTLGDGLTDFRARHEDRFKEIQKLAMKWETVVGEIWKVGINCLGEDAMFALLVTQPAPPSPPAQIERYSLTLADIDPRPSHKKVKFEEPTLKLPKFLATASMYPDLAIPRKVSDGDVKTLKGKVDDLGTEQIDALAKVKKDGEIWWEKKQAQMVIALQKED
jgi:hypothetical protein